MMGATLKEIDETGVLKLAKLGCTNEEIGDFFGVSHETIRRRFVDTLALGRATQKISLRRYQWKSVQSGNVPMQIHLGKQYLGQSDKIDSSNVSKVIVEYIDGGSRPVDASTPSRGAEEDHAGDGPVQRGQLWPEMGQDGPGPESTDTDCA